MVRLLEPSARWTTYTFRGEAGVDGSPITLLRHSHRTLGAGIPSTRHASVALPPSTARSRPGKASTPGTQASSSKSRRSQGLPASRGGAAQTAGTPHGTLLASIHSRSGRSRHVQFHALPLNSRPWRFLRPVSARASTSERRLSSSLSHSRLASKPQKARGSKVPRRHDDSSSRTSTYADKNSIVLREA